MTCNICEHPQREDIEDLLKEAVPIEEVADRYELDLDELKEHVLLHNSVENPQESIARNIRKPQTQLVILLSELAP